MSTERPILFSGEMVRALLTGAKTQTRRLVKPQPIIVPGWATRGTHRTAHAVDGVRFAARTPREATYAADVLAEYADDIARRFCPYGVAGDRLWVRETHAPNYFDDGRPAYCADWTGESADLVKEPRWRPSIHMPRALSRITLEVTSVRVERLQDITEEDAWREGIEELDGALDDAAIALAAKSNGWTIEDARAPFAVLWDEINGDRATWKSNPWVWVVGFKRVVAEARPR